MKKFIVIFIFISSFACSSETEIKSTLFSPEKFSITERVFARITLNEKIPASGNIIIPDDPWTVIHDIKVKEKGREILIWFTPYKPGKQTMPDIDISGNIVRGIFFNVAEIKTKNDSLSNIPGKILIPGTKTLLGLFAALMIIFPFVIYKTVCVSGKEIGVLGRNLNIFINRRNFRKKLKLLSAEKNKEREILLDELISAFKSYLENETNIRFTCFTVSEIIENLPKKIKDSGSYKKLKSGLRTIEAARFGETGTCAPIAESISLLKQTAAVWEKK